MAGLERADGDITVDDGPATSRCHDVPSHDHVSAAASIAVSPPNRRTRPRTPSQAIPDCPRGLGALDGRRCCHAPRGSAADVFHTHVSSRNGGKLAKPPNRTISSRIGSNTIDAPTRAGIVDADWNHEPRQIQVSPSLVLLGLRP